MSTVISIPQHENQIAFWVTYFRESTLTIAAIVEFHEYARILQHPFSGFRGREKKVISASDAVAPSDEQLIHFIAILFDI
jgi:hypothetical protein